MAATPITDEQLAAYESLLHDVGQTTGRALAARIRAQSAEIAALRAETPTQFGRVECYDCAGIDSAIFADRWRCAWAVVGEAVVTDEKMLRANESRREMHRRAQAAEGALADLDWALDHFKIRSRGEWQGYGELDLARRIQINEAQLAEARGLLERVCKYVVEDRASTPGTTRLARVHNEARAWLAANKENP